MCHPWHSPSRNWTIGGCKTHELLKKKMKSHMVSQGATMLVPTTYLPCQAMLCIDNWHMILYIATSTTIRLSNPLHHNLYDYLCYYLNVAWLKLKLYDPFNHHINWWKIAPNRYKTKLFPSNFSWNGWYLLWVCYICGWFGFFSMQFGFGLVGCSVSWGVSCGVVWWLVKQSKLLFSA